MIDLMQLDSLPPGVRQTAEAEMLAYLNQPTAAERLAALRARVRRFDAGDYARPAPTSFVNNHIHTIYSFSPYSPSDAAYRAWLNGLTTAGIMDHDSVSGAEEFIEAGRLLGLATTVGFECRCSMAGTPFEAVRLNNPDQIGVAYVACHGIPHQNIPKANAWLAPYREKRNARNRQMVQHINALTQDAALQLDFEADVAPLSQSREGGSITERHLLYALAFKLTAAPGRGQPVVDFLQDRLGITLQGKSRAALLDTENAAYEYGLLGVLKSSLVEQFYIDATDECPPVADFTAFAASIGAIPAYAYLGDVGDSVTGDKKAQAFEDAFLDELVPWLAQNGFLSVTYMPTRNSPAQLQRIMGLCRTHNLFQISGEDINSPSQSFICKALENPEFGHLITNTWALIGHEKAATQNSEDGMFSPKTLAAMPALDDRIQHFAALGRQT